jgi:hypothetical protein
MVSKHSREQMESMGARITMASIFDMTQAAQISRNGEHLAWDAAERIVEALETWTTVISVVKLDYADNKNGINKYH